MPPQRAGISVARVFDLLTILAIVATFLIAGTVKGVIGLGRPTSISVTGNQANAAFRSDSPMGLVYVSTAVSPFSSPRAFAVFV